MDWGDDFPEPASTRVVPVIRETLLSRRPKLSSVLPAFALLLLMVFASLEYWQDKFGYANLLTATPEAVFERHEYWRLITSLGVHGDLKHLLSNSLFFLGLGFLLFGYFGWAVFPILTIAGGAATNAASLFSYSSNTTLVGASGVVYFMAAFWVTMYCFIERRLRLRTRILRAVGFTLILLVPTTYQEVVSYRTHFIGFVLGCLFALPYFAVNASTLKKADRYEWVPEDDAY